MLPADLPESEIVARAVQGEVEAFGWLYDKYVEAIYVFIYYQVSDQAQAEDLTEVVFLKAFEKLPEFRTQKVMENFRAWVYRIARNLVIDTYRTQKTTVALDPDLPLTSEEPPPENALQLQQDYQQARALIDQLEPQFRQVMILRFINHLSYQEIAQAMDIKENYVRVLQHRALKKLRAQMETETLPVK